MLKIINLSWPDSGGGTQPNQYSDWDHGVYTGAKTYCDQHADAIRIFVDQSAGRYGSQAMAAATYATASTLNTYIPFFNTVDAVLHSANLAGTKVLLGFDGRNIDGTGGNSFPADKTPTGPWAQLLKLILQRYAPYGSNLSTHYFTWFEPLNEPNYMTTVAGMTDSTDKRSTAVVQMLRTAMTVASNNGISNVQLIGPSCDLGGDPSQAVNTGSLPNTFSLMPYLPGHGGSNGGDWYTLNKLIIQKLVAGGPFATPLTYSIHNYQDLKDQEIYGNAGYTLGPPYPNGSRPGRSPSGAPLLPRVAYILDLLKTTGFMALTSDTRHPHVCITETGYKAQTARLTDPFPPVTFQGNLTAGSNVITNVSKFTGLTQYDPSSIITDNQGILVPNQARLWSFGTYYTNYVTMYQALPNDTWNYGVQAVASRNSAPCCTFTVTSALNLPTSTNNAYLSPYVAGQPYGFDTYLQNVNGGYVGLNENVENQQQNTNTVDNFNWCRGVNNAYGALNGVVDMWTQYYLFGYPDGYGMTDFRNSYSNGHFWTQPRSLYYTWQTLPGVSRT